MKLLLLLFVLMGCGSPQIKTEAQCIFKGCPQRPLIPSDQITADQVDQLESLSIKIHSWAPTCQEGIACEDGNDGDSLLWAGLLCSVGEQVQCDAIKASQSEDGRLWRAPSRVNNANIPVNTTSSNSFSRDMLLGFFQYLVSSKDIEAGNALVSYLDSHNSQLCPDATDNRCNLTLPQYEEIWGTMKYIWQYMGATPTTKMQRSTLGNDAILKTESVFAVNNGYTLHLVAVGLYLRQRLGIFNSTLQNAANIVLARQPDNPFYEYVANGKTSRAAELVLQYCPTSKPSHAHQWSWQRDTAEAAWNSSMGWDCIFLIRLLTK